MFSKRRVRVPLLDLTRQHRNIGAEVKARVDAVFDSQQFVLGEFVSRFEENFREVFGFGHAVGMSSGTDAQLAIMMAMDLGPGDAIVTSPYTFFATAGCAARLGVEPAFVDVRGDTLHMDPACLLDFLENTCRRDPSGCLLTPRGNRLRAVAPVHLFGSVCAMDEIVDLAARFGLRVIEDAAQAVGAEYPSRRGCLQAGGIAEAAWFSFFPTKNLGGAGDGGMAVCTDAVMADRLRSLRNHGMSRTYHHEEVGGNFRLDAIQAAVLDTKLPHLADWNAARRRNANLYREAFGELLDGEVQTPAEPYGSSGPRNHHTYHQYVIRAKDRDLLKQHLAENGIGHAVYYPMPLHLQPCFAANGGKAGMFPQAERAAGETLALPIFPELEPAEIWQVAEVVADFYRGHHR